MVSSKEYFIGVGAMKQPQQQWTKTMTKQKLTKKQSEMLGAAIIEAINADMCFQEMAKHLSEKYNVVINEKSFQEGLNKTSKKYS